MKSSVFLGLGMADSAWDVGQGNGRQLCAPELLVGHVTAQNPRVWEAELRCKRGIWTWSGEGHISLE